MGGRSARVEEHRKAFGAVTLAFFVVWFIIAILIHMPAPLFYVAPGEPDRIGGAPLNWWLIQASIAMGIVLAFAYSYVMNKIDEKYGVA